MDTNTPRLAARAIILQNEKLLLVNAYPVARGSDLWCAPGGGVESGQSISENLIREVFEETGLTVVVGALVLVAEFHNPENGFHQVDLFFCCEITNGVLDNTWQDPECIVSERRYFSRNELKNIRLKPDSLPEIAFGANAPVILHPLTRMAR